MSHRSVYPKTLNVGAKINWTKLIISLLICQMAGIIGSIFTSDNISSWYSTLNKSSFNPPAWVFGPTWTILFLLMGISLYFVWNYHPKDKEDNKNKSIALSIFGVHLLLNTLWSLFFFGFKNPGLAFLEIVILWFFIVITGILFYRISKLAGYLLIPYWLWVSFAIVLNYAIWILN